LRNRDWERVRDAVAEAIELAGTARGALLQKLLGSEPELLKEAESLLAGAGATGDGFMATGGLRGADDAEVLPKRVGPYVVDDEVGRGGMGVVLRAHRADGQFDQEVAIKLIKRGMDSELIVSRFLAERQILARLQHPNIARLLDGGIAADGRPYIAMEYIDGLTADEYCRVKKLSVDDRLRLFLQVCAAVEYAHSRLVLHRDLKAGNVLVGADGNARLLDFGIAKLLEEDEENRTATGLRLLTPQSASPEQIRGEPLTTASDVYSLGALLYVLLAEKAPYKVAGMASAETLKAICEVDPPLPSTVAGQAVRRQLRGDLDNIVLKALHKDPARRYGSAEALAEDIRRSMRGLPVTARPDSFGYRAGKFLARHRGTLAAAAVVLLASGIGLFTTLRASALADRRFAELRGFAHSVVFEMSDGLASVPGATAVRELLVKRSATYLDGLAVGAGSDRGLLKEIADSYQKLGSVQGDRRTSNRGEFGPAEASVRKAVAIYERLQQQRADPAVQKSLRSALGALSLLEVGQGNLKGGVETGKKAVALAEQSGDPVEKMAAYNDLGYAYLQSRMLPQALETYRKQLALAEELGKTDKSSAAKLRVATACAPLAQVEARSGMQREAAVHMRQAYELDNAVVEAEPGNVRAMSQLSIDVTNMGRISFFRGDQKGATEQYRRALEIRKKLMDADPGNQRYQDLVATAYTLLVENMARGGDREAVDLAKNGLAFTEGVNRANPSLHTQAQVAESLGALGDACQAVQPKQCDSRQYWQRARDFYVLMRRQGALNIDQAQQMAALEDKLAGRAVATASGPGPGLSGSAGSRGR
jgi:tetratricopeptide (TPR) repeat protein